MQNWQLTDRWWWLKKEVASFPRKIGSAAPGGAHTFFSEQGPAKTKSGSAVTGVIENGIEYLFIKADMTQLSRVKRLTTKKKHICDTAYMWMYVCYITINALHYWLTSVCVRRQCAACRRWLQEDMILFPSECHTTSLTVLRTSCPPTPVKVVKWQHRNCPVHTILKMHDNTVICTCTAYTIHHNDKSKWCFITRDKIIVQTFICSL